MKRTFIVATVLIGVLLAIIRFFERSTRPELADEYGD